MSHNDEEIKATPEYQEALAGVRARRAAGLPALTPPVTRSDFRERAATVASLTARGALKLVDRTADSWLHLPWTALDELVSGISAGDIWFVGAFRSDGKTTWLTSAVDCWYEHGKRIYYLGLESRPRTLMLHWACKRLGIDAGDVLSGRAARSWPNWAHRREEILATIRSLQEGDTAAQVHFSPTQFVDSGELRRAFRNAVEFGADVLILDHIDHVEGDKGNPYEISRQVCSTLMREAQNTGIRALVATQFNNEAVRGNRLARYQPPQPHYVYMGGHKAHIADGMLGLYRPLKRGITAEELKQFKAGGLEPRDVCEQNTMAVSIMKHRLYGRQEGRRVLLRVEHGRVVEPPIREDGRFNV